VPPDRKFTPVPFGRYVLTEHIATGGMADIFKGFVQGARGFQKTVVIKRILPNLAGDDEFLEMFIGEAKVMVELSHPKIVQVLDFGEVEGDYFIAMEYVDGVDLLELLRRCAKRRARPSTGISVHIMAEVLDALDYAHALCDDANHPLGIVHRDISPSNIFVSRHGEVKLGDFGIAQAGTPEHTSAISMRGKYGYMSPEQVSGKPVDQRADIFACGIVLAELLMVRRLFLAESDVEVLLLVRDARLDRLERYGRRIQGELRAILLSALSRDSAMRYQTAGDFRDALQRFLFDNRRMVRTADVRAFLEKLYDGKPQKSKTGPPRPAVLRRPTPTPQPEVDSVGSKRRIRLRPPPTPKPLPRIQTSEESRIGTEDAIAALPELGSMSSTDGDFRVASGEVEHRPTTPTPRPETQGPILSAEETARDRTTPIVGVPNLPPPDLHGKIDAPSEPSMVRLMFRLAAEEATGLLMLQRGEEIKEIYLVDGDPRSVTSNRGDELFGQYLVRRKVINEGELAMALAMLPHFDGKLGDTLVALKLLKPVQVARHLTHQVRAKLLEIFGWREGTYWYYRGLTSNKQSAPLGLDAFELIGAGVAELDPKQVEQRLSKRLYDFFRPVVPAPMPPEIFRLGRTPRQAYEKLNGQYPLNHQIELFDDETARATFIRMTYLLIETGLVEG
jgi:serine/threonine protein kinase